MSYINKKSQPLINLKLTNIGRKNLANGGLTFQYYALGDSEMNYSTNRISEQNILRPVDDNPGVQYKIAKTGATYYNSIDSTYAIPSILHSEAEERGFFVNNDGDRGTFNTDLFEFGGLTIDYSEFTGTAIGVFGTNEGTFIKSVDSTIEANDYLLLKVIKSANTNTISQLSVDSSPYLYLWYLVMSATESEGTYTLTLDRELPDLTAYSGTTQSYGYIYKGGNIVNNLDNEFPTSYWDDGLLDFTSNSTNSSDSIPIWNFNIYHIQDIIGVNSLNFKGVDETEGELFAGIYSYLGYGEELPFNKIGVIHYTNNTVSNFYGEGFYSDTMELHLPTLMWHKQDFGGVSKGTTIGYTFVCDSEYKIMGDSIGYYDLIDQEDTPTIVGKVLPMQKIVIIENAELIAAMSLKSNRNFTLPKPTLSLTVPGLCNGSSQLGSLKTGETMHVTYMLGCKAEGIWYQPCEDYASISNDNAEDLSAKDVNFSFDNSIVNNFPFLYKSNTAYGYSADVIYLLTQINDIGEKPSPSKWNYFDVTNYLGSAGCLEASKAVTDSTELNLVTDNFVVTNPDLTLYQLSDTPSGAVLVSINGATQKSAIDAAHICYMSETSEDGDGDYIYVAATNSIFFGLDTTNHTLPTGYSATKLKVGDVIQVSYLAGTAVFGAMEQHITVPTTIDVNTYGTIYIEDGSVYLDLEEDPAGSVYVIYNGVVLSTANYDVTNGGEFSYRVKLLFTPNMGSHITLFYGSIAAGSTNLNNIVIKPSDFANLTVNISYDIITAFSSLTFKLDDFIALPSSSDSDYFTFGDENFFFGNISTEIQATIYKTLFTINVLPNTFNTSQNPTFNADNNKVLITEIGIYDTDYDLVAIGKFSQPLIRKSYGDMLIIQASIDF